jgi:hypothetical protein
MDQHHIATLTCTLSRLPSRRDVLRGMAGTGLGLATLRLSNATEAKNNHHKKRKKRKHTRVDATCSGTDLSGGGNRDGNFRIAQSFTALASGLFVTAQLPIVKEAGSDGDYVLRLSPLDAGFPTNAVLAQTSVANANVPSGGPEGAPVTFTFGTPASVVAGTQYALMLTRPGGGLLQWRGDSSNPCTGRSFFSPNQTESFQVLSEGIDLNFVTFVRS